MEVRQIGRGSAQIGRQLYSAERLAWALIGLGVLLRLAQYSANRSIWLDESFLVLNIIHRPLGRLLQPLDYCQGAPLGFLVLEKLVVQAFGSSEYALRLIPLVSGILSLLLFYHVARRTIRPGAVPVALGLFAILEPLIYYSSEVKQYSSDVVVALAVFASARAVLQGGGLSAPRTLGLAIIGAVAPWFSHPATFILMGAGTVALTVFYRSRDWDQIRSFSIVVFIWMLSLALFYLVSLRHLTINQCLLTFWTNENAFVPFPLSLASVRWLGTALFGVFEHPVGLYDRGTGVAAMVFLVSAIALWTESRATLLALLLPFVFALAASAFRLYPFGDRLLLFGVSFIVLLIGDGMERIVAASRHRLPMIGMVLAGFLFLYPALSAGSHLITPRSREEIRPVVAYLKTHEVRGDVVYLYRNSRTAFQYYAYRYGLAAEGYVNGNDGHDPVDLDRLRGKRRAWILFSHVSKDNLDLFLRYLDRRGARLDTFESNGAGVYLYDLRE